MLLFVRKCLSRPWGRALWRNFCDWGLKPGIDAPRYRREIGRDVLEEDVKDRNSKESEEETSPPGKPRESPFGCSQAASAYVVVVVLLS